MGNLDLEARDVSDIGPEASLDMPVVVVSVASEHDSATRRWCARSRWSKTEDIAERLLRLCANPDLRNQLGRAAPRGARAYALDAYREPVVHDVGVRMREK